jgi:hypothetical protein
VLLPLVFVFQIVSIVGFRAIEDHIWRVLALLLHCRPSVVLQAPRVMAVLFGDFSTGRDRHSAGGDNADNINEQRVRAKHRRRNRAGFDRGLPPRTLSG